METLETVLKEIAGHLKNGGYKNEEHVRVGIVLRILQALGWDIWNPRECWPEYAPIPSEDSKRVDVALFKPPSLSVPALFIEVKTVEKLKQNLAAAEEQLEYYCRRNQSEIAALTDGQRWHFYLSGAPGKFEERRFKTLDLLNAALPFEEAERAFHTFLSRESLADGEAANQARLLLRRTEEERVKDELLPFARKDAEQDPTSSLVECFIKRCSDRGISVSTEKARAFILERNRPITLLPPPFGEPGGSEIIRGVDISTGRNGSNSKTYLFDTLEKLLPVLTTKEIEQLQEEDFCHEKIGLNWPLLTTEEPRDHERYYTRKLAGKYYICSQWYDKQFNKWEQYLRSL